MSSEVQIVRKGANIKEAKELEIASASAERLTAILEYIAACDHPEILIPEGGIENE